MNNRGIGTIKVTKQENGTFKASASNVEDVIGNTEREVILKMNDQIKRVLEEDASKAPFRILQ